MWQFLTVDSVLSSIQVLEQVIVGFPAHGKEFSPRLRSPSILSRWKFLPTGWKTSHDLAIPMHSPFMVPKLGRMHHYIFDIPGNWCEPWNSTHTYIDIYIGHKVVNFSPKTTLLDHLADLYVLGDLDPHQLPLPNILHLHHHSTNKQKYPDINCCWLFNVNGFVMASSMFWFWRSVGLDFARTKTLD